MLGRTINSVSSFCRSKKLGTSTMAFAAGGCRSERRSKNVSGRPSSQSFLIRRARRLTPQLDVAVVLRTTGRSLLSPIPTRSAQMEVIVEPSRILCQPKLEAEESLCHSSALGYARRPGGCDFSAATCSVPFDDTLRLGTSEYCDTY